VSLVLYHRIDDPDSAAVRRRVVELGLKPRVDFENIDVSALCLRTSLASLARAQLRPTAQWDGERLHEGRGATLAALEALRR
jgi:hypothetical protein